MTFQNLKYIIEIANCHSISQAAKNLYMTQSAVSNAVKETEKEVGIRIFERTSRGVLLTYDGEDFLKYCKEIVSKTEFLATKYQSRNYLHMYFSVSAQHLPFAVRAFRKFLNTFQTPCFDVSIREADTATVFRDVTTGKSELGICAFHDSHILMIRKSLFLHELSFTELTQMQCYVFVRKNHPLAREEAISIDELKQYPFVTYDNSSDPDQFTEEPLFYELLEKNVHVTDRSIKLNLIRNSDAFSIAVDLPNSNADSFFRSRENAVIAVPLKEPLEPLHVGYIFQKDRELSSQARQYLDCLKTEIQQFDIPAVP